jgi:hypothetical protein
LDLVDAAEKHNDMGACNMSDLEGRMPVFVAATAEAVEMVLMCLRITNPGLLLVDPKTECPLLHHCIRSNVYSQSIMHSLHKDQISLSFEGKTPIEMGECT